MVDHEIILDHATKRSRGFGFVVFDNEKVVDEILADGNMVEMSGSRVSLVAWLSIFRTMYPSTSLLGLFNLWCNLPFSYKCILSFIICSSLCFKILMSILQHCFIYY